MSLRATAAATATAVVAAAVALGPTQVAHAGPADAPTAPDQYRTTPHNTPLQGNFCTDATDPQGDPITVAAADALPATFQYNPLTCAYTWTPVPGATGFKHARFKLTDGTNVSDWIDIWITVGQPDNEPVVAQPDSLTADKDRVRHFPDLRTQLASNDQDPEGQPRTVTSYATPADGGALLPGEKFTEPSFLTPTSVLYYPPTGFVGTRTFEYVVSDGVNQTRQTYSITIAENGPLVAPVANPDSYVVPKNGSLTMTKANGVLVNDVDQDSVFIRVASISFPKNGTLTFLSASEGTFKYVPAADFTGTDSFTYTIADAEGNTSPSTTVTFQVKTVAPVAVDDAYQMVQDGQLVVAAAQGLMVNDYDVDSGFTISNVAPPGHGTVSVTHATGAFVYTPTPGWSGSDFFGYRLVDPDGNYSTWAIVTVQVVPPATNAAPLVVDDHYQVRQGGTLTVTAAEGPLANDSDLEGGVLKIDEYTPPANGVFTSFDLLTGAFTYEPAAGWHGTETVPYQVIDPEGAVSSGTITITVFNDPPVANDDSYTAVPGVPLVVPAEEGVLANDTDAEGEQIKTASWSIPQHGSLTYGWDGSFTYTPDPGFTGVEKLTYDIEDEAKQKSDKATITITVAEGTLDPATPTVGGTAKVGRVVTAEAGSWGPGAVTLSYQWLRGGSPIPGATDAAYPLTAADQGRQIAVEVTGSRTGYAPASRTSAARVVESGILATSRPRIKGKARAGRTLRAKPGSWGPQPVQLTYRWLRNGKAIRRASSAAYTLTRADRGKRISVRVTGRKPAYTTAVLTSASVRVRRAR
ncbi:Ig-like domain-containing protein [Nocardioides sp.]|uniref:Ig-like domain-containing protein n=1 Tax=Nocardioides sp. TaxID=35761 RepID=UPI002737733C|nr:Ig-like domain-containing protein [Nocardioides sp.]MDP3894756.1 Ig-like domain-containing protein [Nocardioides sp.]